MILPRCGSWVNERFLPSNKHDCFEYYSGLLLQWNKESDKKKTWKDCTIAMVFEIALIVEALDLTDAAGKNVSQKVNYLVASLIYY